MIRQVKREIKFETLFTCCIWEQCNNVLHVLSPCDAANKCGYVLHSCWLCSRMVHNSCWEGGIFLSFSSHQLSATRWWKQFHCSVQICKGKIWSSLIFLHAWSQYRLVERQTWRSRVVWRWLYLAVELCCSFVELFLENVLISACWICNYGYDYKISMTGKISNVWCQSRYWYLLDGCFAQLLVNGLDDMRLLVLTISLSKHLCCKLQHFLDEVRQHCKGISFCKKWFNYLPIVTMGCQVCSCMLLTDWPFAAMLTMLLSWNMFASSSICSDTVIEIDFFFFDFFFLWKLKKICEKSRVSPRG